MPLIRLPSLICSQERDGNSQSPHIHSSEVCKHCRGNCICICISCQMYNIRSRRSPAISQGQKVLRRLASACLLPSSVSDTVKEPIHSGPSHLGSRSAGCCSCCSTRPQTVTVQSLPSSLPPTRFSIQVVGASIANFA